MSGDPLGQDGFRARLEWGADGLRRLAAAAPVVVVVDVLRFTTCVEVVLNRGATVRPARWTDASGGDGSSAGLSPVALAATEPGAEVTLPSPNGAALAVEAATPGATVLAGCLRNATAVGRAAVGLAAAAADAGALVVVAAGERWGGPSGPLRVAVEDLVGAGAVLAAGGRDGCSPEALAAVAAFEAAAGDLDRWLASCGSGRELVARGFAADVAMAAELDAGTVVPVLRDGLFAPLQLRA